MKLVIKLLFIVASFLATPSQAAPAKRIVALAPHIVEMLYEIGVGDRIVGTTDYADYPESAKQIPRIANHARIQIEQVVALQPDMVIAWQSGSPSDDVARLRQLGFKIVYSQPNTLADIAEEMRYFGQLTGVESTAERVAENYEHALQTLLIANRQKQPISVFYEIWSNPLSTVANNAWPNQVLAACNVKNVFAQAENDYPQVGLEQVISSDPAVIIQPGKKRQVNVNAVDWQQWPFLSAVKHKRFIHPDADHMHRMTPRVLTELTWLCQQLDNFRQ